MSATACHTSSFSGPPCDTVTFYPKDGYCFKSFAVSETCGYNISSGYSLSQAEDLCVNQQYPSSIAIFTLEPGTQLCSVMIDSYEFTVDFADCHTDAGSVLVGP